MAVYAIDPLVHEKSVSSRNLGRKEKKRNISVHKFFRWNYPDQVQPYILRTERCTGHNRNEPLSEIAIESLSIPGLLCCPAHQSEHRSACMQVLP